jgi:DNA-binding NarL/FixJ family response regulator
MKEEVVMIQQTVSKRIRLLIVDDVSEVRRDLRTLLPLAGDFEIVGEAAEGQQAIQQVDMLHPDAVLLDLAMPVLDGYAAARLIKMVHPDCRVIALSVHGYPAAREKALRCGVDALVVKGTPVDVLVREIVGSVKGN